jgi:hypothetical protein
MWRNLIFIRIFVMAVCAVCGGKNSTNINRAREDLMYIAGYSAYLFKKQSIFWVSTLLK